MDPTDGYFGFSWGKTIEEYAREKDLPSAVMRLWRESFRDRAALLRGK